MSFERVVTDRLVLRKPAPTDAENIYARYASDPEVTRFLAWPRHQSVEDTRSFLRFSDEQWACWPAGPYLIESRNGAELMGSTGLAFESPHCASTGYVLKRDTWGLGYASEALAAIVEVAAKAGVRRLYALCHPDHVASRHVLEKAGFDREGLLHQHTEFPNLQPGISMDVLCYARMF